MSAPKDDKGRKSIYDFQGFSKEENDYVDRDVSIDPIWEKQQKKTFTAWCNLHLKKVNQEIKVIEEDFRSGLNLLRLLEVIAGERLPKPERGKMRVHTISNVNKALNFIEMKGVKLVSIGAEEIVDGNVKMTLGMIWTIILRFAIQGIKVEDMSANEGLLLWCKRSTANHKNVNITNFNTSFKDGLAFCALINRYRPDLLEYDGLIKEKPADNLSLAFKVAEDSLGIPKMLDVEDMINTVKPDDRSVMAYVSCFYHVFAGAQKTNVAASRIGKAIDLQRMITDLENKYNSIFSDLKEWIINKKKTFEAREQSSVNEAESSLQGLRSYRTDEKPSKIEEKAHLEMAFRTLQTRLRLNNRPAYLPGEGRLISDIDTLWKELELKEKEYEKYIFMEFTRLENLERLLRQFNIRCKTHETWAGGKMDVLQRMDCYSANLSEIRSMLKKHETFQSDILGQQARVDNIKQIADQLRFYNYELICDVDSRCKQITSTFDALKLFSDKRREEFADTLSALEHIDGIHLELAKCSARLDSWMQHAEEDLQDVFNINSIQDADTLLAEYTIFESNLDQKRIELENISKLNDEIFEVAKKNKLNGQLQNPYITISPEAQHMHWEAVLNLASKRPQELQSAKERELKNNELRKRFAIRATTLSKWLEDAQSRLNNVVLIGQGTLEQQFGQLKEIEADLYKQHPQMHELEQCYQDLLDAYVFENSYSTVDMPTIRSLWEQFSTEIKHAKNELENQTLTRDSRGLTKQQIDEFRSCFNHFDRNRSGALDQNEFKALLISLGHSEDDPQKMEAEFNRIMSQVGSNSTSLITFDAFMNFMALKISDLDSSEQMLESFRTIAGDKGYVTSEDIRRDLSSAQADYCLAKMRPLAGNSGDAGALDYETFVMEIYGSK